MNMVERVARRIAAVDGKELPRDLSLPHSAGSVVGRSLAKARAAIEAMRTPTEAMKDAGAKLQRSALHDDPEVAPDTIWLAMIDAALNEERP